MKVCLVIPPSATEFGDPDEACSEFVQQRVKEAPLGILAVAAVVRQAGYPILVVDLNEKLLCDQQRYGIGGSALGPRAWRRNDT